MTRIPLSIDDTDGAYIASPNGSTRGPPEAWFGIALAAFFLLATGWHCFLLVKWRSYLTWLFAASSIGKLSTSCSVQQTNTRTVQCLSLVEFAYSTLYPLSTVFLVFGTLAHWFVSRYPLVSGTRTVFLTSRRR